MEFLVKKEKILTERIKMMRRRVIEEKPRASVERSHIFTDYWKNSDGEPIAIRRAKAFEKILEEMSIAIHDGELIVGGQTKHIRGGSFYPEFDTLWVRKEVELFASREVSKYVLTNEEKEIILKDLDFWQGRTVTDRVIPLWRKKWGELPEKGIQARICVDTTCLRHGRQVLNYPKVINLGLKGIIEEVKERLRRHNVASYDDLQRYYFWQADIIACTAVIKFAKRYSRLAIEIAEKENNLLRKEELKMIAKICEWVPENPARTFYEALQSFWFAHLTVEIENNSWGYSPGRFDQYMYPFYKKDIRAGRITKEQAAELLACLWIKFNEIELIEKGSLSLTTQDSVYQNITIGGQTEDGQDASNELSHLILEVTKALKLIQPTISLRYFDGVNEEFLLKAADVVRSGGGMPAFFNDKYALSCLPYYGVSLEEAREWTPTGCVEMSIPYKTTLFMGDNFLSLPHCLELVLNNGIFPKTGERLGLETGNPRKFSSFEELLEAFKKQVNFALEWIHDITIKSFFTAQAELAPVPYNSALIEDCIQQGKDIFLGGAKYKNMFANFPIGCVTTANSLTAIKKLVFEDKLISMDELLEALKVNFLGKEHLRKKLLNAPKYGNDDDYADEMLREVMRIAKEAVSEWCNPWGEPIATAFIGVTSHYYHGAMVGATPDGRYAYTPFADGSLSAYPGSDRNGPTAVVNSAAKADIYPALGSLFNLKFHPSLLKGEENLKKFLAFVKTYFDLGGYHIQFNVVGRETLLAAKKEPEKYKDLVVRLAGFSVFFVDLSPAVQDEIISRTEHVL